MITEKIGHSRRAPGQSNEQNPTDYPAGGPQVRALPTIGLAILLALIPASAIHAAVLTDPSVFTGTGAIDPAGAEAIDFTVPGSTTEATLEARPDFLAVHDFTGFVGGTTNIISFTDSSRPDMEFSLSGNFTAGQSGAETTTTTLATSGGSAITQRNTAASTTSTLTIDFGSWNGSAFDGSVNSVGAAAFALTNCYAGISHTVTFLTSSDTVLYTTTFAGASSTDGFGNHRDIYIGFASAGLDIGKITIARTTDSSGTFTTGLDDVGFTTVPEPNVSGLLAAAFGMQLLLGRIRSRTRQA